MFSWFISPKKNENTNKSLIENKEEEVKDKINIPIPPEVNKELANRIKNSRYNYLEYYHPEDLNEEIIIEWNKRQKRSRKRKGLLEKIKREIAEEFIRRQLDRIDKERIMKSLKTEISHEVMRRNDIYLFKSLNHIYIKDEIRTEYENRLIRRSNKRDHEDCMYFLTFEIPLAYKKRLSFRNDKRKHEDLMFFLEDELFVMHKEYLKFIHDELEHKYKMLDLTIEIQNFYKSYTQTKNKHKKYMRKLLDEIEEEYENRKVKRSKQSILEWCKGNSSEDFEYSFEEENTKKRLRQENKENIQIFDWNEKFGFHNHDEKLCEWNDITCKFHDNALFQSQDIEMGYPLEEVIVDCENITITEADIREIASKIKWGEDYSENKSVIKSDFPNYLEEKNIPIMIECDFSSLEENKNDPEYKGKECKKEMERKRLIRPEHHKEGFLEVVIGPMFSGKSTEIAFKLSSMADQRFRCLYINSIKDVRTTEAGDNTLTTHNSSYSKMSSKVTCIKVKSLSEVNIRDFDYIAVDELQFFDSEETVNCILDWISVEGKYVLVASLDGDCYRRKFGRVLDLLPHANSVKKLTAYCDICRDNYGILKPAPFTARMTSDTSAELVGGNELYKAMCRNCHDFHLDITVKHY